MHAFNLAEEISSIQFKQPLARGGSSFTGGIMKRLTVAGWMLVVLAVTGFVWISCGGGGGGGAAPQKVAVVGDYTGNILAEFLSGEGLSVDNYPLNQNSGEPAIWGSIVVWEDTRSGPGNEDIYAYSMTSDTEFKVNQDTGDSDNYNPRVHGDYIVWQDRRHGTADIYAYEISTGTEFIVNQDTPGTAAHSNNVISDDIVAWADQRNGDYDIYARNISTMASEFRVDQDSGTSDQGGVAIDGEIVAWLDWRNGNPDVYARNISSMASSEFRVDQDPGTAVLTSLAVFGDYIVWQDQRNGTFDWDIYARNISNMASTEFRVNTDAGTFNQTSPAINGNYVVWVDARNGNSDIYARNISTMDAEFKVNQDVGTLSQNDPSIYGDFIVWYDWRNGNGDIYAYQISTATEFQVNQDSTLETHRKPAIYGDHIVWEDERNIYADIFMYSVATSTEKLLSVGKVDVSALPAGVSGYSALLFGNEFHGLAGTFALQLFDAADAANVNMLGIGTDEEYPLGYLLADDGRFGLTAEVEYDGTIIEVDVTSAGLGHPIFNGMNTANALTLEVGGSSHQQETYSTNSLDANSPSDWTILANYSSSMIFSGQCAIAEFTTPNGTKVILDGSSTNYNDYIYWTQTAWDMLYNEVKYLMDN